MKVGDEVLILETASGEEDDTYLGLLTVIRKLLKLTQYCLFRIALNDSCP